MDLTNLLTLLIGGILGLLSGLILERQRKEQALTDKLFERYLLVREELTEVLGDLASLKLEPDYTGMDLNRAAQTISKLFYRHYDFLPANVLRELNCLYRCLAAQGKHIYIVSSDNSIVRLDTTDRQQFEQFAAALSLVENIRNVLPIYYEQETGQSHPAINVNLQARKVIRTINQHFQFKSMLVWSRTLTKPTLEKS